MPYIPWAAYGICKFWMLKRCYQGDRCQWKHPSSEERSRLWNTKTAEQDAAAARGVPRPKNPRLQEREETPPRARDDSSMGFDGRDGGGSRAVFERGPPPPPPPPPPSWPPILMGAHSVEASQLPSSFAGRGSERSGYNQPLWSSHIGPVQSQEVSMLDAPDSPAEMISSTFDSQQISDGLHSVVDGSQTLVNSADVFNGLVPEAVAVWKREGAVTSGLVKEDVHDASVTGADHAIHGQPAQSDYWTRYRNRRGAMNAKVDEGEAVAKEVDARGQESAKAFPNFTPQSPSPRISGKTATGTKMGATKRMSNGDVKHVGPHPSTIHVSARYASHASIEKKLQPQPAAGIQSAPDVQERLTSEAREDSIRLQGCRWIDDVRRQMQLPIRTFTTACTYYHKFRLAHPQHVAGMEYGNAWADACAASLLTACKVEDTLKKSKDILAAAHNLRAATSGGEQVGTDDAMFEAPSRVVIGLERLVLEAGSFDFRSKYPHELMVKIAKTLDGNEEEKRAVTGLAWSILTDLHRTFVPLKQTSASMAVASLELASHLYAAGTSNESSSIRDSFANFNFEKHSTSREEVMETILDALDLYTHHTLQTLLGAKYGLDDYLRIRLAFNKECSENSLPRFTLATPRDSEQETNGNTLRVQNGHPTPVSPPQPETQTQTQAAQQPNGPSTPEGGGTQRFILNPQLAADEKSDVQKYFVEEWEEFEEEIEVPLPRAPSPDRGSGSERSERRPPLAGPPRAHPSGPPRGDYRGGGRYEDRRGGRYEDRRYDDRRYDDRRGGGGGGRYDDRRYDDRRRERR